LKVELEGLVRMQDQKDGGNNAAGFDDEHDGIPHHFARIEFENRVYRSPAYDS
jgi:hypothetical protein